jgi:hypothetical protein
MQKAEADTGFPVVKQVHVTDPEFVWRGLAKLPEVVFRKGDLVNIEKYWQRSYNSIQINIVFRLHVTL